jgi:hypothetical protein
MASCDQTICFEKRRSLVAESPGRKFYDQRKPISRILKKHTFQKQNSTITPSSPKTHIDVPGIRIALPAG